jgi:hypothetical protein
VLNARIEEGTNLRYAYYGPASESFVYSRELCLSELGESWGVEGRRGSESGGFGFAAQLEDRPHFFHAPQSPSRGSARYHGIILHQYSEVHDFQEISSK